jgi:hypothetical protein
VESRREQAFWLKGFAVQPTRGTVTVISYDREARIRRAFKALGTWWGCALGSVFIPVAHFGLVPGFFIFGIIQFFQRLGTRELGMDAAGTCPDCGAEQELDLPPRWRAPQQVTCKQCQRGLTLTASEVAA